MLFGGGVTQVSVQDSSGAYDFSKSLTGIMIGDVLIWNRNYCVIKICVMYAKEKKILKWNENEYPIGMYKNG